MHGRKKSTREKTDAERETERSRAANYRALTEFVWAARKRGSFDLKTLAVVSKLLSINTDEYTLWNYRREILLQQEAGFEPRAELELTAACLLKQPKSYPSWSHRLWVLNRHPTPELLEAEVALCAQFLEHDERNFHCWNYRREIARLAGEPADVTRAFARTKLDANFSNYSAFHELYATLPECLSCSRAQSELEMTSQALFTEPDDQSAWWYHSAILQRAQRDNDAGAFLAIAQTEAASLRELRNLEPESKWPTLALLRLLLLSESEEQEEIAELHAKLLQLDPSHANLYALPHE